MRKMNTSEYDKINDLLPPPLQTKNQSERKTHLLQNKHGSVNLVQILLNYKSADWFRLGSSFVFVQVDLVPVSGLNCITVKPVLVATSR